MNCYTYAKMLKKAAEETNTEQTAVEPADKNNQGTANMLNENWNKLKDYLVKNRSWALPTAAGVGMTGLSYAGLGLIPAMRRNTVLRLLASGAIGAATAGGAYYVDNVYGKQKPKVQA